MAAANAKSREKQAALDSATSARREAQDALEAAESELEEARLAAEDARHEMQQTAKQAALQQAASQQVLSDTRAMVTSLEKERDILAAKLNEIRVQSKDGSLKLEEDLRVARKGLLAMQEEMQKQKASFAQKRELAKTKFMELVARADDAEHVAQEAKAKATQAAENLVKKEAEMAGRIAYLEGTLKVVTMERDKALEAQEVCTDGADADRERLIASLATTQAELKEQRQKRLVAKNEILTMVRQLDANRDSMSTLFTQLQQLVTKTGTFVIECRSMETKCDDALIALDIEADMDVNIEFTRKVGGGSGGEQYRDCGTDGSDGENDAHMVAKGRRGHKNLLNGLSVEMSGLSDEEGQRRKEQQRSWPRPTA